MSMSVSVSVIMNMSKNDKTSISSASFSSDYLFHSTKGTVDKAIAFNNRQDKPNLFILQLLNLCKQIKRLQQFKLSFVFVAVEEQ